MTSMTLTSMTFTSTAIQRLRAARSVAVLTGAGISAESGIATFRDPDGIWSRFRPEELASMDAFLRNPQRVWEWYQSRRRVVLEAQPNAGHRALAALETLVPRVTIITQNIDGLHQQGGSSRVLELHGSIRGNFCVACGRRYDGEELLVAEEVVRCECGGAIRPDVVWFGEMLPMEAWESAERAAEDADVFLSVGTSAVVYPAAGLPLLARQHGAYLMEINAEPTPLTEYAHEFHHGPAGALLTELVEQLAGN